MFKITDDMKKSLNIKKTESVIHERFIEEEKLKNEPVEEILLYVTDNDVSKKRKVDLLDMFKKSLIVSSKPIEIVKRDIVTTYGDKKEAYKLPIKTVNIRK